MDAMRGRGGFVLMMTLVSIAVVAIVVGSLVGFVAQGSRFARVYIARDRCRFAAQSAVETAGNAVDIASDVRARADAGEFKGDP